MLEGDDHNGYISVCRHDGWMTGFIQGSLCGATLVESITTQSIVEKQRTILYKNQINHPKCGPWASLPATDLYIHS